MKRAKSVCFSFLLMALLLFAGGSGASSPAGQPYEVFTRYYKENVDFINLNDNRHLLPLVMTRRGDALSDGRQTYELIGDTLNVTIAADPSGKVIEQCVITLTAQANMEYGSAIYNDFAISGYQSFALLMAMHADTDPGRRYELVPDTVNGMAEGNGSYTRQVGIYTLTCSRMENTVTLEFWNNRVERPSDTEKAPENSESPEAVPDAGEDEGAGLL